MKQRGRRFFTNLSRWVLATSLLLGSVATVAAAAISVPQGASGKFVVSAESLGKWQTAMKAKPAPKVGCFTSSYPNLEWEELRCNQASNFSKGQASASSVLASGASGGYFGDYMALASGGSVSAAEGSFPEVSGVVSVAPAGLALNNEFSLQLNTNVFDTPACKNTPGVPTYCGGWVQFAYQNEPYNGVAYADAGNVSIWYWIVSISACPTGWTRFGGSCYITTSVNVPLQDISDLANMRMVGQAQDGGLDTVTFITANAVYKVSAPDNTLNLAKGLWTGAAFNIYGIGDYEAAMFNSGAEITVKTSLDNGTTDAPTCVQRDLTGEGNNLSRGPCCAFGGSAPSIMYLEASSTDPGTTVCPSKGSVTVTTVATENGTISPAAVVTLAPGSSTQFTISPNAGYSIASVTGCDGSLDGNTYTTAVLNGDCQVTATFVDSSVANVNLNQFGLSGAWENPAAPRQGIVLSVLPDMIGPGHGLIAGGWFTFDYFGSLSGDQTTQKWYALQGPVDSTARVATLRIYASSGGRFDAPPKVPSTPVGMVTLQFSDCMSGTLTYQFFDGSNRFGTIPIGRVDANVTCSPAGDTGVSAPGYQLSGPWYQPSTSGQGFFTIVNPVDHLLYAAWYTYKSNGVVAGGTAQRWYVLQAGPGSYTVGSSPTYAVPIYTVMGGSFNSLSGKTAKVGFATVTFISCTQARIDYNFTNGEAAGLNGSIDLTKLGPVPADCGLSPQHN